MLCVVTCRFPLDIINISLRDLECEIQVFKVVRLAVRDGDPIDQVAIRTEREGHLELIGCGILVSVSQRIQSNDFGDAESVTQRGRERWMINEKNRSE